MTKRTKQLARKYKAHKKRIIRLKGHPFVIPVATFLILFFISMAAFVSFGGKTIGPGDARLVRVYVDGKQQTLPTRAQNVGDLLSRLDITLNDKDIVEPSVSTPILEDNFNVTVYRAHPVTISEGDKKVTFLTTHSSPDTVAREAGFNVYPEDEVEPVSPRNALRDGVVGAEYVIDRAPVISLNLYGNTVPIRTRAQTVGEALKEKGIVTQANDTIVPSLGSPLTATTKISVTNVGKQIVTVEEAIDMPVETTNDPNLAKGTKVVKQAGSPGKKVTTYELKLENGKEVARTAIQSIVAVEPTKQIVTVGTKVVVLTGSKAEWMAAAGINSGDYMYVDSIIGRESGWRPNAVSANRCIGLGQKCNAQSLINACPNWETDPVCQLGHFSGYAKSRYGGWSGAYTFWQNNHWW